MKQQDFVEAAGIICVVIGCFTIAPAAGFIVAGLSLVVWGIATGRKR